MPYLSRDELQELERYQYQSGLYSFIDRVIMTPFWNRAVTFLPMSLAPNLVTLIALTITSMSTAIIAFYAPTMSEPLPRWTMHISAVCLFIYQTLDAIDGKQARRTKSSSPLGQLFDHGCDSIGATLIVFTVSATFGVGNSWMAMLIFTSFILPFYGTNWEECQTGVMRFAEISVTEAQFMIITQLFISGCFGVEIWHSTCFGYRIGTLLIYFASFGCCKGFIENVYVVFQSKTRSPYAMRQFGQFLFFIICANLWCLAPGQNLLNTHPFLCIGACGICFSYLINRLIISNVTKGSFSRLYVVMWPFPLLVINAWFPFFMRGYSSPFSPLLLAYAFCFFVCIVYAHFSVSIIREICSFLNIHPFLITNNKSDGKKSN